MNAINQAFQKAKAQGNGALIGYIMAGDPKPEVITYVKFNFRFLATS